MKYFALSFLLIGFLALPVAFGDETSFQVYSSDGNHYSKFIKIGEETHLEKGISNDADLTSIGTIEFYIRDAQDNHRDVLKTYDFSIKSGESEKFTAVYTPTKTGYVDINVDINYLIPQGDIASSSGLFIVVDDFSKTFAKNHTCKEGFEIMVKPHFSSVVCVSKESSSKLADRWNS